MYSYSSVQDEPVTSNYRGKNNRGRNNRGRRGNKRRERERWPLSTDAVVSEERNESGTGFIKKEKFGAINYAPRGQGELWRPG